MAHDETHKLFGFLLEQARLLLTKNREMYPIAASLSRQGEITPLVKYEGDEHPESQKVIEELALVLISRAFPEKTAALGLAYDVRFAQDKDSAKRDGIKLDLEHADGDCLSVVVPYHFNGEVIELEEPFMEDKQPEWFKAQQTMT